MSYIYALESDSRVTDKKERDRLGLVNSGELIKCKVCSKQHKKKECKYQCKWCHMYGSHKSDQCFKKYPDLKKNRGDKRDRSRSK